jgi:hypothetical protein
MAEHEASSPLRRAATLSVSCSSGRSRSTRLVMVEWMVTLPRMRSMACSTRSGPERLHGAEAGSWIIPGTLYMEFWLASC